jgi:recombinational DNA repair ATPase RecF
MSLTGKAETLKAVAALTEDLQGLRRENNLTHQRQADILKSLADSLKSVVHTLASLDARFAKLEAEVADARDATLNRIAALPPPLSAADVQEAVAESRREHIRALMTGAGRNDARLGIVRRS